MSKSYAVVSAVIFALVAVGHVVRLANLECIMGCRCRFCPDRNLGPYAIGLTPQQAPRINHASYRKWTLRQSNQ